MSMKLSAAVGKMRRLAGECDGKTSLATAENCMKLRDTRSSPAKNRTFLTFGNSRQFRISFDAQSSTAIQFGTPSYKTSARRKKHEIQKVREKNGLLYRPDVRMAD
jgi:hypothetical protein